MKKLCLIFVLCLTLTACARSAGIPETTAPVCTTVPAETSVPLTEPATAPIEETAAPVHSDLYIPGLSVEDVILYFNEVCLDAEFTNSGDPSHLQKWDTPISYHVYGSPTQEDLSVLAEFAGFLNGIVGFPGITQTDDPLAANLAFHFCTQQEMLGLMGDSFTDMDGAVTFWYDNDRIYDAIICCRTDLDQTLRNSVILEELYNSLGPIQDTLLRPDSVIYAEFSQPQALTEIDELILKLLYHSQLLCGMDAGECDAVIRQLYY